MSKHVCGLTGKEFATREEYLAHVSPVTGFTPTDLQHQGTRGILVAKEALRRKGKLTKGREAELDAQIQEVSDAGIDDKLMRGRQEAKKLTKGKRPAPVEA